MSIRPALQGALDRSNRVLRMNIASLLRVRILAVLVCFVALAGRVVGDDTKAVDPPPNGAASDRAEQQPADGKDEERKRKTLTLGLMVLFCITLAGLGGLLIVILWGHRVRRISRKPLPEASRGDELFYLKKENQTSNRTDNEIVVQPPPQNEFDDDTEE